MGTDFYSKFPNFSGLSRSTTRSVGCHLRSASGPCGARMIPASSIAFFGWVNSHPRVRMLVYNQGYGGEPFQLSRYPRAAARIRAWLWGGRWPGHV